MNNNDYLTPQAKPTARLRIANWHELRDGAACSGDLVDGHFTPVTTEVYTNDGKDVKAIEHPWFPQTGEQIDTLAPRVAIALRICATCPVRKKCEEWTADHPPVNGGFVQGGTYYAHLKPTTNMTRRVKMIEDMRGKLIRAARRYNARLVKAGLGAFAIPGPGLIFSRVAIPGRNDDSVTEVANIVRGVVTRRVDEAFAKHLLWNDRADLVQGGGVKEGVHDDELADEWADFTGANRDDEDPTLPDND